MNDEPCMCQTDFTCLADEHVTPEQTKEARLAWEARQQRDGCDPFCMAPFGSHHLRCKP